MRESDQRPEVVGRDLGMTSPYLPVPAAQMTIDGQEAGLQLDYAKLFRKYVLLATLMIIFGAGGGFLSVALLIPEYQARALLDVQSANGGVLKMRGVPEDFSNQIDLTTEAQILESRTFLQRVLQRLQVETSSVPPAQSDIFSKLRRILRRDSLDDSSVPLSMLGIEGQSGGTLPKALAMALLTLKATPVDRTHLIEITCESPNPHTAADFLNGLIDEYIRYNYETRLESVRSTTQWISEQLDQAKARMTDSEARLDAFTRKSGDTFVANENTLADARLKDLQERLAETNADLINKQTLYEAVHKTPPDLLPNVIDDPGVRQYQARIADLRREEATLTTTLMPGHPKVKNVEAQIADLQAVLQKELSAAVKRIDNQYQAAKRAEDLLRSNYAAIAQQVTTQAGKVAQYNTLKKEADSARESYAALVNQANQVSVAGSLPANNIQAIDRAVPASKPYKPKPMTNIGAGAAVGLALCCGIAFLREKMDKRVASPKHARQLFNLPQLGVIPSVADERARRHFLPGLGRERPSSSGTGTGGIVVSPNGANPTLSASTANPLVAESFRATLASLMLDPRGTRRPQTILVTSAGPEEGKTTITSNLGVALAETGRNVLILDADFRRPRLHKLFGIANKRGLVDILEEGIPVGSYPREALGQKTFVPHLHVFPSGTQCQNIAKLLYSVRFRELMYRLKRDFDTILIDTCPLLSVSDARVISDMADGVVFVIRVGVTKKDSVIEALEELNTDRTVVLGTVLNDWKPTKSEARHRYYYSPADSET